MALRITIVLDEEIAKKLRKKQSIAIRKTNSAISFSSIVNETLDLGLKER